MLSADTQHLLKLYFRFFETDILVNWYFLLSLHIFKVNYSGFCETYGLFQQEVDR